MAYIGQEILVRQDGFNSATVGHIFEIVRVDTHAGSAGGWNLFNQNGYYLWQLAGEPAKVGETLRIDRKDASYHDAYIAVVIENPKTEGRHRPSSGNRLKFRHAGFHAACGSGKEVKAGKCVVQSVELSTNGKVFFVGGGYMKLPEGILLQTGDAIYPEYKDGDYLYAWFDSETEVTYTSGATASKSEGTMVGNVYSAVVVRTKTVAAGEGLVATSVQTSEIVSTKSNFIALSDEMARAVALSEAMVVDGKPTGLRVDDPTQPVEVRLAKFGGSY